MNRLMIKSCLLTFGSTVLFVSAVSMQLAAKTPSADLAGFAKDVRPLLSKYCSDCHGPDEPAGKLSLSGVDPDLLKGNDLETWRIVKEQLRFADMPPKDAEQPSASERETILKWIGQESLKTQLPGFVTDEKLLLPQFGNYIDHETLFDKRLQRVYPAEPRIWRLRPSIYRTIVPRLGEQISGLANALNTLDGSEFKDFSAPYFLDEASTQQLLANAKKVAASLVGPNTKDRSLKELANLTQPASPQQVNTAIDVCFRKALGRGPTPEEQQRFAALYYKSIVIGGYDAAAQGLVAAVLLQPEFMFRQELGDGQPDEFGRVRLSQREIAFALSYTLANMPLDAFTKLAAAGELKSSGQVAAAVRLQLQDDSLEYEKNPRAMQFFREYFHYPFADEVFKDQPAGGDHKASALIADLEWTIKDVLREDKHVLAELLTTRKYYINVKYGRKQQAGVMLPRDTNNRKYQTAFGLPLDWKWSAHLQPVEFREDERAGVLTHPAWLAAWSGNFDNHPVQRGKWVRTHLLGGSVPDVPIGVDARVPEAEHTTFRNRLKEATKAAECWRCHKKMDPLGVTFERYDHYGRVQRLDAGQAVVATGSVDRTPFSELHGEVSGPTELMDRLAKSERVQQVFVRHVFRYLMGRNETLGDANTLQDAHQAYRENDGSFRELVVAILASDSFLYRQMRKQKDD
ncbi:MAG: hypothetical protein ACI9HK_003315 [Pirellulaceae bacterium]|jgi:hypothetical protein